MDIAALLAEAKRPERTVDVVLSGEMVTFTIRAIPPKEFARLVVAHPPRPDVDGDRVRAVNMETFPPAVLKASLVEPEITPEQVDYLLGEVVNWRQWDDLCDAAMAVNTNRIDIPLSPAGSPSSRTSDETSKPPNDSE